MPVGACITRGKIRYVSPFFGHMTGQTTCISAWQYTNNLFLHVILKRNDCLNFFYKLQKGTRSIRTPIIFYEYKPQIPLNYQDIYAYYICEVMIQAYYCVKNFTQVIHCLTVMSEWHYFKIEYNRVQDSVSIIWTHSFSNVNISQEHVKFLYQAIKPIFDNITMENAMHCFTIRAQYQSNGFFLF